MRSERKSSPSQIGRVELDPREWLRKRFPRGTLSHDILLIVLSVALTTFVGSVVVPFFHSLSDEPSVATQLEEIRRTAAEDGMQPTKDQAVDLRATGEEGHLFVFRDGSKSSAFGSKNLPTSDEIRIYSEEEGELSLSFAFKSEFDSRAKASLNSLPIYFELAEIADADGNGRPEVLGSFMPLAVDTYEASPFPVVITWDDRSQSFRIFPLVDRPPSSRVKVGARGLWGRSQSDTYRDKIVLSDSDSGEKIEGYSVLGFALGQTKLGDPAILESFVAKGACHVCAQTLEIRMLTAEYQSPPETHPCLPEHMRGTYGVLARPAAPYALVVGSPSKYLKLERPRYEKRFACP